MIIDYPTIHSGFRSLFMYALFFDEEEYSLLMSDKREHENECCDYTSRRFVFNREFVLCFRANVVIMESLLAWTEWLQHILPEARR